VPAVLLKKEGVHLSKRKTGIEGGGPRESLIPEKRLEQKEKGGPPPKASQSQRETAFHYGTEEALSPPTFGESGQKERRLPAAGEES